jgi:hypothetical protein
MYVRKALVAGIQRHTVRWFLKGPGSSLMIVGTLALAGLGAAALNSPAGAVAPSVPSTLAPSDLPIAYGCFNDLDGDGTIKCDASVPIAQLPAAWGTCRVDLYGDGLTVCDGTSR